jgi:hypothetical protein
MSVRVMSKVWEYSPHSENTLLTFLALADWADEEGNCFPSMAKIAAKSRQSERNAQRCIHDLVEQGWITLVDVGGGRGNRPTYQINIDKLSSFSKSKKGDIDDRKRVTLTTEKGDIDDIAIRKNHQEPSLEPPVVKNGGEKTSPLAQDQNQNHIIDLPIQDAQRATVELLGVSGYTAQAAKDAVGTVKRRKPEMKNIEVPVFIMKLWREVSSQPKRAIPSLKTFLSEIGSYVDSDHWKAPQKAAFVPQIDWQGGHVGEDGVYVSKSGQRVPGFICPPKPNYSEVG